MLSNLQALFLGALQGISELFPVSSLGHSVIIPAVLGWHIDEQAPFFLVFLVATHFATALVLFIYFWKDWFRIIGGVLRSVPKLNVNIDADAKLGWLIIVSTIPAGILGLVFQDQIRSYFIAPLSAAFFLFANGILLYVAERYRRKAPDRVVSDSRIAELSFGQGILVGTMQSLALIPGFSRTGASIAGGLIVGLSHEDAVRFSFLLATPIIGAAAALKLPSLLKVGSAELMASVIGAAAAAVFAYLAVRFLTRYFAIEKNTLTPFAIYCAVAGLLALLILAL